MTRDQRGFSDAREQAAFSRAVAGLVRRGVLRAHASIVPIAAQGPGTAWAEHVLELAGGTYLNVPPGEKWQRRFIGYESSPNATKPAPVHRRRARHEG